MTFEEVEQSLPNGFHDARLLHVSLDTVQRCATVKLSVHVSEKGDSDRERYRTGVLKATSVCIFFMEPPDARYDFVLNGKGIGVSGDAVRLGQIPEMDPLLRQLPSGATAYRFFLEQWNSFFYLAAGEVAFSWDTEGSRSSGS
jgi:hypothetical protein